MTQPPRRGIHGSETFLTGMEYLAVAQYMLSTLMCVSSCVSMAFHGVYSCLAHITISACNSADNHKSGTVALIIIFMTAYLGGQAHTCSSQSRYLSFSQTHNAKNKYDVYCFQTSAGLVHNRLFFDSDASRTIIHDANLVNNIHPLQEPCTVQGLTGAQSIEYQGDMQLNMVNNTGKRCSIIIKGVYYNPQHPIPTGMFDLIKISNVYLLPVNPKDDQGLGTLSGLIEEERMHYHLNHDVNPKKMVILLPQERIHTTSHLISLTCQKVKTISGCQYCTIIIQTRN